MCPGLVRRDLLSVYQYGDNPDSINWNQVKIIMAVSFVAGSGLILYAARQPSPSNGC